MAAIGLSWGLLAAMLLAGMPGLRADTHAEVVDLFASMTAALTEDPPNPPGFMRTVDRKAPEYDELNREVKGLVLSWRVASSVEFLKDEGDNAKRSVDLDWYFELRSLEDGGPTVQRRQIIHCGLTKQGKHWRIVSIKPVEFFKP